MTVEERFWAKVDKRGKEECWWWTGAVTSKQSGRDYGSFFVEGRLMLAHRFSYMLHKGSIPENHFVLHDCDEPRCVNPEHLRCGNQRRNMRDSVVRGRSHNIHFWREENPRGRFNAEIIMDIRRRYVAGESQQSLAEEYGTDQPYIYRIVKGHVWSYPDTPVLKRPSYRELYAAYRGLLESLSEALGEEEVGSAVQEILGVVPSEECGTQGRLPDDQAEVVRQEYLQGSKKLRDLAGKHGLTLSQVWDALYRG